MALRWHLRRPGLGALVPNRRHAHRQHSHDRDGHADEQHGAYRADVHQPPGPDSARQVGVRPAVIGEGDARGVARCRGIEDLIGPPVPGTARRLTDGHGKDVRSLNRDCEGTGAVAWLGHLRP